MEELTGFEILAQRMMYICGYLINRIVHIFIGEKITNPNTGQLGRLGFDSPLLYLAFGFFLILGSIHIFKRILRKD